MPALCTWPAFDASAWPSPRVPYPVRAPYRPRPDLVRLGGLAHGEREARVLDADTGIDVELRAKLQRLRAVPQRCVALAPELAADPEAVWRRVAAAALAIVAAEEAGRIGVATGASERRASDAGGAGGGVGESASPPRRSRPATPLDVADGRLHAVVGGWSMPADPQAPFELVATRADARPVVEWIAARPAAERPLHALALAIQEDVVIVEAPAPGAPVRATLLHVCWPSGWDPAAKAGLDFAAIHAPVADGQALRAASIALSRALVGAGPFVRHVWTLAAGARRARHPDEGDEACEAEFAGEAEYAAGAVGAETADGLDRPDRRAAPVGIDPPEPWFRCERQASVPLPRFAEGGEGGAAVFLIRLHLARLGEVASSPERLRALREALDSMSPEMLAYKRLDRCATAWRAWIDARLGEAARGRGDTLR